VVSRSEESVPPKSEEAPADQAGYLLKIGRRSHRDDVEFNELDIKIRISYKTLVLVFVLFDVFHKIVNSLSDSDFVQSII
jgi:hypothetical protein